MADEARQPFPLFEDRIAAKIKQNLEKNLNFDFETYRKNSLGLSGAEPWIVTVRAWYCDNLIRRFLTEHPNGLIVEFGGGMDARYFRVTECGEKFKASKWLMIDLDKIVDLREAVYSDILNEDEFIKSDFSNFSVKKCSVADIEKWTELVDEIIQKENRPVLFTDMACLAYVEPETVKSIFRKVASYPKSWVVYNTLHIDNLKTAGGKNDKHSCKNNWKWLTKENFGDNPLKYLEDKIKFRDEFCVLEKCYELRKLRSKNTKEFEEWKSSASEVYPEIIKHGNFFDSKLADLGYNLHWVVFE